MPPIGNKKSAHEPLWLDLEMHCFPTVEFTQDRREVGQPRIAARSEHPHQVLRVDRGGFAQTLEATVAFM
jgi:hypothetical protein